MINFNGNLQDNNIVITNNNRAYAYGDGLFETIKAVHGKLLFFEDHTQCQLILTTMLI